MKLVRFGSVGRELPGIQLPDDTIIDVSMSGVDYDEQFFGSGGIGSLKEWLKDNQSKCPVVDKSTRLGPPICRPSKIICIGLNFSDHAKESGVEVPKEPVLFFKSTTALCGPNDDIVIPRNSKKTDWEVELAVVVGKKASYIDEKDALTYIAGYVLHNDYSEREFQLERCGQWNKGKSSDTFAPIGPFLATPDEIKDPENLNMWCDVNGVRRQTGNTSYMVYKVPFLISYISQFMTLLPGDVISTGTPPGVGLGFKPPIFLKAGDVVELGIDGLGISRQKAVNWER